MLLLNLGAETGASSKETQTVQRPGGSADGGRGRRVSDRPVCKGALGNILPAEGRAGISRLRIPR